MPNQTELQFTGNGLIRVVSRTATQQQVQISNAQTIGTLAGEVGSTFTVVAYPGEPWTLRAEHIPDGGGPWTTSLHRLGGTTTIGGVPIQIVEIERSISPGETPDYQDLVLHVENAQPVTGEPPPEPEPEPPAGTFPVVVSVTTTQFDTEGTTKLVNIPAVNAGDRLVVLLTTDGQATVTPGTGFTQLDSVANGTEVRHGIYYRDVSTAAGASTVDFPTSASEQGAAQVYRIQAGTFDPAPPELGVAALGSGSDPTEPNPPNLQFSWGAAATLVIAAAGTDRGDQSPSPDYPSNYTNGARTQSGNSIGLVTQHSAQRQVITVAEDPGPFKLWGSNEGWVAQTIALKGGSGEPEPEPGDPLEFSGNAKVVVHSSSAVGANQVLIEGAAVGGTLAVVPGNSLNVVGNATGVWTLRLQVDNMGAWVDRVLELGELVQDEYFAIQFLKTPSGDVVLRVERALVQPQAEGDLIVQGRITWSTGAPYVGLVRAFDKDLRVDQLLGEANADLTGYYSITYQSPLFVGSDFGTADVFVRAIEPDTEDPANDVVLGESFVIFNAPNDVTINLVLDGVPKTLLSEFEILEQRLSLVLDGAAPHEINNQDDINFLQRETGFSFDRVRYYAVASDYSEQLGDVPSSVFYGLFRQGITEALTALLIESEERLRESLEAADSANIISIPRTGQTLDELIAALLAHRISNSVSNASDLLQTGTLNLPTEQITELVQLQSGFEGTTAEFWEALRNEPNFSTPGLVEDIQAGVQSYMLSDGNIPLAQAIQALRPSGASDMSALLDVSLDQWIDIVEASLDAGGELPQGLAGDTEEDAVTNYARGLRLAVEGAFTTRVLSGNLNAPSPIDMQVVVTFLQANDIDPTLPLPPTDSLDLTPFEQSGTPEEQEEAKQEALETMRQLRSELTAFRIDPSLFADPSVTDVRTHILFQGASFQNEARSQIATFLNNASTLDLVTTRVGDFLGALTPSEYAAVFTGIDTNQQTRVIEDAKALQRIYAVAPKLEQAQRLLGAGFRSAESIARVGVETFVRNHGAALGNETVARAIHRTALRQVTFAGALFAQAARILNDWYPRVLGGGQTAQALKQLPEWANLFGPAETVLCPHCRSVLSPAAYLVDVLHFIQTADSPPGTTPPFSALLKRRPDLILIPLSCEHTDTLISHSQLTVEILEAFVARGSWPNTGETPWINPNTGTANWDSVRSEAYTKLASAPFPLDLPFSKGRLYEHVYLEKLGLSRAEWLRLFSPANASDAQLRAWLRLWTDGSTDSFAFVFNGDTDTTAARWGLNAQDSFPADLQNVAIFLRQTGLSFVQLKQLLDQRYVNPSGALSIFGSDPTDLAQSTIPGLDVAALSNAERFLRVWKVLSRLDDGRTLYEVDATISAFGGPNYAADVLNEDFGILLSGVDQLRARLQLEWLEVLALLLHLDTRRPLAVSADGRLEPQPSFYERLFQNPQVGIDPDFALTATGEVFGTGASLVSKLQVLQAALEMTEPDVRLLISHVGLDGANLSFANLAALYARSLLIRALPFSTEQYIALVDISSSDPLAPSALPHFNAVQIRWSLLTSFAALADTVGATGFDPIDLRFILRHEPAEGARLAVSDDEVVSTLERLIAIARGIEDELTAIEPDTGDGLRRLLEAQVELVRSNAMGTIPDSGLSVGELGIELLALVDDTLGNPTRALQLVQTYLPFLGDDNPLLTPQTPPLTLEERRAFTVRALAHDRWRGAAVESLGEALDLEATLAEALLEEVLTTSASSSVGSALGDVLAVRGLTRDGSPDEAAIRAAFATSYRRAKKSAFLVSGFDFSREELLHLHQYRADWSDFDFNLLPLAPQTNDLTRGWFRLANLVKLESLLPTPPEFRNLLEVFDTARAAGTSLTTLATVISDITGWPLADTQSLVGSQGRTVADYTNADELLILEQAIRAARIARVSAATLIEWVGLTNNALGAPHIRQALRSRFDTPTWDVLKDEIDDELLNAQRKALVSYVLGDPMTRQAGVGNVNQLYEYLLIDVDLTASWRTSRIREAGGSVQLFVQRVLLNLELGVSPAALDAGRWKWMSRYRVWEANRKVFIYPENYLLPELRRDKTELFRELEAELQQGEITPQTVEAAYRNYLRKLDDIARLEIVTHTFEPSVGRTHVVGRTADDPAVYYYRRFEGVRWTPWERMPLEIPTDHVVAHIFDERLFIFWAEFTEKSEEADQGQRTEGGDTHTRRVWSVRIGWSEYRDGKWAPKRLSTDDKGPGFAPTLTGSLRIPESFSNPNYTADLSRYRLVVNMEPFSFTASPLKNARNAAASGMAAQVTGRMSVKLVIDTGTPEESLVRFREIGRWTVTLPGAGFRALATNLDVPPVGKPTGWYAREEDWALPDNLELLLPIPAGSTSTGDPVFGQQVVLNQACGAATLMAANVPQPVFGPDTAPFFFSDPDRAYFVTMREPQLSPWQYLQYFYPRASEYLYDASILDLGLLNTGSVRPGLPASSNYFYGSGLLNAVPRLAYGGYWIEMSASVINFQKHYHPHTNPMLSLLNSEGANGVAAVLRVENQLTWDDGGGHFVQLYEPTNLVDPLYPPENIEFTLNGAYSDYNWEIFFHIPMFIAVRLTQEQRFVEAREWFHYVFDPTTDDAAPTDEQARLRVWQFAPFRELTEVTRVQDQLLALADINGRSDLRESTFAEIADWLSHPFEPHRIARLRIAAYEKWVFMQYIENLLAEADSLFARDSRESIGEATQLYVMASNLLGDRPETIPDPTDPQPLNYSQLAANLDEFSNALREIENHLSILPLGRGGIAFPLAQIEDAAPSMALSRSLYFCVPGNDKLTGFWDRVDDRLFKIRNGLDINGVARSLPLFEPPIDPLALVRAVAGGLDIATAASDLASPLSHYRFSFLMPKALELVNEVRSFGSALLSALEKRDAEGLSNLRARQETGLLSLVRRVREKQVEEAKVTLTSLERAREVTQFRQDHYRNLERINARERNHLLLLDAALGFQIASQFADLIASGAHAAPTFIAGGAGFAASPVALASYGGQNVANAAQAAGRVLQLLATISSHYAARANVVAGWERREEDWDFQADSAERELAQIDEQIEAQKVRIEIAEQELRNHERQQKDAQDVESFLRDKFTNEELYSFMSGEVSRLYFGIYQLAYRFAKQTERAYRFERALTTSDFISFGAWDSLRKGLLAGERLALDLRRLDVAYLDQNRRELELTRNISLLQLNPRALILLRETGSCTFTLPETLFDLDYPGHYLRRIKSVSLSIPCVVGPNEGVHATLSLISSKIRFEPTLLNGDYVEQSGSDPRFLVNFTAVQSIATSNAQADAGVFELSLRDERFLPFEGAGLVSTWQIEMPQATNAIDFDTIADVVLRIQYTSRDAGEPLRSEALAAATLPDDGTLVGVAGGLSAPAQPNLTRMFSVRQEFSDSWPGFLQDVAGSHTLAFALESDRFPLRHRRRAITPKSWTIILKPRPDLLGTLGIISTTLSVDMPNGLAITGDITETAGVLAGVPLVTLDLDTGALQQPGQVFSIVLPHIAALFAPGALDDILLVCHYEVS